jgi:putative transposase
MLITKDGAYYRQCLPHYHSPGSIYHCRFSIDKSGTGSSFTEEWMFAIVEEAILDRHKVDCLIYAYVVMADHTHAVVQPLPMMNDPLSWRDYQAFHQLESIVGKIKGRSARLINKRNGKLETMWQREAYDRTIRNERDLEETIDYVHHNPVRWRLVESPEQYRWSSLRTIYSGEEKYRGWFDLPMVKQ